MSSILAYPDRTLVASLSGGSWKSALPLANLRNMLLSKVARSNDALAASTIIQANLGAAYTVRVIALCAHNCSAAATIRVRGFSDSGYTTMVTGADSGTVTLWPAGFTAADVADAPKNWTFVFTSGKSARYWKAEITDTANSSGYIELGRFWLSDGFEPATGIKWSASLGYESRDVLEESIGGVAWGEKRISRRSLTAAFSNITPAEKRVILTLQKSRGTSGELYWITNGTAAAEDMLLEAFPATLKSINPLSYPYYNNNEMPIELQEIV